MKTGNEIKRVLVALLITSMVFTAIPVNVFAGEELFVEDAVDESIHDSEYLTEDFADDVIYEDEELPVDSEGQIEIEDFTADEIVLSDETEVLSDEPIDDNDAYNVEDIDPEGDGPWSVNVKVVSDNIISENIIKEIQFKISDNKERILSTGVLSTNKIDCNATDKIDIAVTKVAEGYEAYEFKIGTAYYKLGEYAEFARYNKQRSSFTVQTLAPKRSIEISAHKPLHTGNLKFDPDIRNNVFDHFDYQLYGADGSKIGDVGTVEVGSGDIPMIAYENAKYMD